MPTGTVTWPAEWWPQRRLWVGWPRLADEWGDCFEPACAEIAAFVEVASGDVPVRVAVGDGAAEAAARAALPDRAEILRIPTGDIWLRDTGPVFVLDNGALAARVFRFNGWGGKFNMPGDTETARAIARAEAAEPCTAFNAVLEGGAVESDGQGAILTTRSCLLNSNRNGWTENDAETWLHKSLSAECIHWIDDGLEGDHTDGHVDNIARFVAPGHVVCQVATSRDDPHRDRLREISQTLSNAGLTVSEIPSPGVVAVPTGQDDILPASHLNYTITNRFVLVPIYDGVCGAEAVAALAPLFPGRSILGLPANSLLAGGGGAFHCMTCHVPDTEPEAPS
ncbi:MAG: agmatine deiminase family protein [Pseudomonadota bacterium]